MGGRSRLRNFGNRVRGARISLQRARERAEQAARRISPRRGSQRVGLLKCLERAMTRDLMIAGTLVSLVALALYGVLGWSHRAATDQRTTILRKEPSPCQVPHHRRFHRLGRYEHHGHPLVCPRARCSSASYSRFRCTMQSRSCCEGCRDAEPASV